MLNWGNEETERFLTRKIQLKKPESYVKHWIVVGFLAVMLAWMWWEIISGGQ